LIFLTSLLTIFTVGILQGGDTDDDLTQQVTADSQTLEPMVQQLTDCTNYMISIIDYSTFLFSSPFLSPPLLLSPSPPLQLIPFADPHIYSVDPSIVPTAGGVVGNISGYNFGATIGNITLHLDGNIVPVC
jgi:hypothetical protein